MPRPTTYTEEQAADICDWISKGRSLAAWCRETGTAYRTVLQWLGANLEFSRNYASAREAAGDADADLVSDIRDRALAGEIPPDVARVAIDACKWSAGKRQPKKYGERIQQDITAAFTLEEALKQLPPS